MQPHNVLLDGNGPQCKLKLCDFGLASAPNLSTRGFPLPPNGCTLAGSPGYFSPEVLLMELMGEAQQSGDHATAQKYQAWGIWSEGCHRAPAVDIWGAGVTFMAMVTGESRA